MIFKVYFQVSAHEVPVREKTNTLYIKADSEGDVRRRLADRKINIEYIQKMQGAYLEYEQQNDDFKVLEI